MKFTTYILMMLSFSIVFYFIGYKAPLITLLSGQGGIPLDMASVISLGLAGIVISYLVGFASLVIIPILFAAALLNYLVFPTSLLISTGLLPDVVSVPLLAIFNVLTCLALLNIVRGGAQ